MKGLNCSKIPLHFITGNQYGVTALRGGHFTCEVTARGAVTSLRAARFQFCILADCSERRNAIATFSEACRAFRFASYPALFQSIIVSLARLEQVRQTVTDSELKSGNLKTCLFRSFCFLSTCAARPSNELASGEKGRRTWNKSWHIAQVTRNNSKFI